MDASKILLTDGVSGPAPKVSEAKKPSAKRRSAKKKRLPAAERRLQLIDAARDVFLSVGREGVSTHQIAEAAGVNVALLYQHFSSSAELFHLSVLEPLEKTLTDRVAEAIAAPPSDAPPRELLAALHLELLTLLIETAPMLSIALFGDQQAGRDFYTHRIEPLVTDWIEATYRRLKGKHRAADFAVVAKGVFGIHLSLALFAHLLEVDLDAPAVTKEVSDFIYFGVSAPVGT